MDTNMNTYIFYKNVVIFVISQCISTVNDDPTILVISCCRWCWH